MITSLTRDGSDPRALAYVYQQQDAYLLFYIKTANLVITHIQHTAKLSIEGGLHTIVNYVQFF